MIEIIDKTEIYRAYDIKKYVGKYLKEIPMEDLKGISKINIYDDSPSHFPKDKAGGYYPNSIEQGAEIDIFLHQTLGCMIYSPKMEWVKKVKNRIFLMLFGKLFIADTLFHEVGHHKSESFGSRTEEESEEEARNYAYGLLGKIYPFIYRNYDIFNKLYKKIYRKRIEQAKEIGAIE